MMIGTRWGQGAVVCVALLCQGATAWGQTATERIDPAGIGGALLLCGQGPVSREAVATFFELAGGAKANMVVAVLPGDETHKSIVERLKGHDRTKPGMVLKVQEADATKEKMAALAAALNGATGVWIAGDVRSAGADARAPLAKECGALLRRGGIIGAAGTGAPMLARGPRGETKATVAGLGLLPGSIVDAPMTGAAAPAANDEIIQRGGAVGFRIEAGAAILLKGRTLFAVGGGKTTITLGSKAGQIREVILQGKQKEDLTALRRSARDRLTGYPWPNPGAPFVDKGTLVIVGGGKMPDGLLKSFVDLAGGKQRANIVIFPTAQPDPLPKNDSLAMNFRKAGARTATVLYGRTRAEVESKPFLDALRAATGLWFEGGRQWRFVDCYEDTDALPLMFDVLRRGGVIGGSSAGASIQGDYLCRGGVFNNELPRYEGYERGLGFLKGVAIDQHFTQRKRHGDMTALMKIYPQFLGIGIDETTALVVRGSVAEIIGKGKAHFYDTQRKREEGQPDYEALAAGGRYDLKARKIVFAAP
jgi:cyanophycinase